MTAAPFRRPGPPTWVLDLGLFATVAALAEALIHGGQVPVATTRDALSVSLALHLLLRIYDGRFDRWRTVTWLLLVGVNIAAVMIGFWSALLPVGQMSFWLATKLADVPGGAFLWQLVASMPWIGVVLTVVPLALDILALHGERVARWRPLPGIGFALAVVVFVVCCDDAARLFLPSDQPPVDRLGALRILPTLDQLPFFAILRAVPSKTLGLTLAFAILLLPLVTPWMRAWRFHAGSARAIWSLLCAGLATSWLALAFIGASAPSDATVMATWALAAYQLAFFLVAPPAIRRVTLLATDPRGAVFD